MKNNLPINLMFSCGIGFLYLAFIHNWKAAKNYMYLMITTLVIFILLFFVTIIISNINFSPELTGPSKIHMIVGGLYSIIGLGICVPGMIVGFLGSLIQVYMEHQVIKSL